MTTLAEVLPASQRAVADRVIAEEESRRRHLCVALSGAHAYGFPSPDSDFDLKCVHVAPTADLVGLHQRGHEERMGEVEVLHPVFALPCVQLSLVLERGAEHLGRLAQSSLAGDSLR